jgi:5-methylcytosine-specific restriction endonuclease McrA
MADDWLQIFDDFSTKVVSRTDKSKGAYVPTKEQKAVILGAGFAPTEGPTNRVVTFGILGSESGIIEVSYYSSLREGSGRTPETRMGRGIVGWIDIGDHLTIGRIGTQLFLSKEKSNAAKPFAGELGRQLAKSVDPSRVIAKAKLRKGPPPRQKRTINDFIRDPYVVAAALLRAKNLCEMPNCTSLLFNRDDDKPYLEVHHITPLGEGGDDELNNTSALCPRCHRELHYGKLRSQKRATLSDEIDRKMKS